jgi:hypothetical protein
LFSGDSNATSLKVVSASLGDFLSCQIMTNTASEGIEIKETECPLEKIQRCLSIGQFLSIPLPNIIFFSAEQSEKPCNLLNVTPCDKSLLLCNTSGCFCSEGGQHLKNNWF